MGKQYYCEYCLRSFKDSAQNRKKHLKSSTHLNARREYWLYINNSCMSWFDKSKHELEKSACNHFYRHKWCKFGDSCRFSHLTPQSLQQLKDNVLIELNATLRVSDDQTVANESICDTSHNTDLVANYDLINLQTFQKVFGDISAQQIPVSLIPAKLEDFSNCVVCDWG